MHRDNDDAGNICTGGATTTFIQAYIRAWRENLCPLLLQLSQLWSGVFIFFKENVDLICASFFCSAQALMGNCTWHHVLLSKVESWGTP